jgi:hypothetical protein
MKVMKSNLMMAKFLVFNMPRIFLILFAFFISLQASAKLDQKALIKILRDFVQSGGQSRFMGTAGHQASREFLLKYLKTLPQSSIVEQTFSPDVVFGQSFYQNDFDSKVVGVLPTGSPEYNKWYNFTLYMKSVVKKYESFNGQNIIWERKGASEETLIIGAHYDTVVHDPTTLKIDEKALAPGADYNGSGVAMALALAQYFSALDKLQYTVKIVFFDMGALANLGSYHFVKNLDPAAKQKILGLINLEMLGHDSITQDAQKKAGNMAAYINQKSAANYSNDQKLLNLLIKNDEVCKDQVEFQLKENGFSQSDHFHFWQAGIGAMTLSQDWEDDFNSKRYQTSNDFVETLNFETLYGVYRYLSCNLGRLVRST